MSPVFLSDRECVELCLEGDLGTFEELFDRYYGELFRFVRKRTDFQIADIEDIVAETFFVAFMKLQELRDPSLFSHWLFGIAHKKINKRKKKPKKWSLSDEMSRNLPAGDHIGTCDKLAVHEAFERLPKDLREIVSLRLLDGLTLKIIANKRKTSISTAYRQYSMAMSCLRRYMSGPVDSKQPKRKHTRRKHNSRKRQESKVKYDLPQ